MHTRHDPKKPFSEIVRAGDTYYIAGRIARDAKTNRPPEEVRDEARLLMDGLRDLLLSSGL